MKALGITAARKGGVATHVVSRGVVPTSGSITVSLAGAAPGDVALLCFSSSASGTSPPFNPSGWLQIGSIYTWPTYGYGDVKWWKVLNATDIANGVVLTGGGVSTDATVTVQIYRGCTSLQHVTSATSTGTNVNMAGFTKNANSRGIITRLTTRQPSTIPVAPAGFVERVPNFVSVNFKARCDEKLDISNYVNGTAINYAPVAVESVAWAFELLG